MLVDKRFVFRMLMARNIAASVDRKERLTQLPAVERAIVSTLVDAIDRGLKRR